MISKKIMDRVCRHCGQAIELSLARQLSYNYICNTCANRRRDSDVCRYIARKLADSLRRKGLQRPYPGVNFVRQVVERYGARSALSGNANPRHLCVVLKNVNGGYTVDNAVLVTSGESCALSRSSKREDRELLFERMRIK